ncbi:MAG: phenylalanine--tRNA ligase subunit beta [Sphingomonadales bacterium]|nr:phenylalanine--tRNA ligase subunit beta [Sphingomonadales bacterium]
MKFSLSWLKAHLDTEATAAEIATKLNAIGLEVEGVEDPAERLAGFRVARVLTAARHPDADKLQVLSVDLGDGNPLQVVCGAPNARAGLVGVLGLPGATVPANGMVLKKSAIRGIESNGMMCSTRELELGEDHDGIIELPEGAPLGMPFAEYHGADPVFDVSVTPNRPDCMGVYGIARDLAAAGLGTLRPIAAQAVPGSFPCPVEVRTDDADGCPAFYGRVIRGLTNGPSPEWMQARLKSAGQRPISALVDVTNYVMLTYGRPAHAYDLAQLSGAVVARRAKDGESVTALNGKDYALDSAITVIADDSGVHDIAGIMGGEHSGCSDSTTEVLLEVAYFDPERIAATGRKLNLTSDARQRFERGVDPTFLDAGLELLTTLIVESCGGEVSEVIRAGTPPAGTKTVAYDPSLCATLGGVPISDERQKTILESLGFVVTPLPFRGGGDGSHAPHVTGGACSQDETPPATDSPHPNPSPEGEGLWQVTAPGWRPDIDGAPDIVEEVVRIHGLDNIASVPLPRADGVARPTATAEQKLERRLRRAAASLGLNEAITWSFISEAEAAAVGGGHWVLQNPISEDMKVMRPSLLPGLLSAVRRNLDRGASSVRLFEIGRRYLADGEYPALVLVLAGERQPRGWQQGKAQDFDAFDAKAACTELLRVAGAPVDNLQVMPVPSAAEAGEAGDFYHPGQSATLRLGPKNVVASFGMVHPATLKAFDIGVPVAIAGIHLDAIPARKGSAGFARVNYAPPALQAVTRDFAFLLDADKPAGDLLRAVKGADKANIVAARLFDDFRGQGVPEGQKSLAVEVTLQPQDKSYTDDDLKAIADKVTAAAAKLGAVLRG